jgi:DNA-binding IclR family transcriptional regulator
MEGNDAQDRNRQQLEQLLDFPGVGPLPAGAIASNLGVPAGSLDALLDALAETGRVTRADDGRFTLPAREMDP